MAEFTGNEISVLEKYFTNVDKPVFGLINMSEVVKSALFARYSRSSKSLRRLFLDEFYDDLNKTVSSSDSGNNKAEKLFDRVFVEYGDDSVAQLGGAHIACERCSNVLVKILERGRLASYLEQSTRYVYYDDLVNNSYKYYTPDEFIGSSIYEDYKFHCNDLFKNYGEFLVVLTEYFKEVYPQGKHQTTRAYNNIIKAKACDVARNLLPASTQTNLGIFATGQSFEWLLIKMYSYKNVEIRKYADMILEELRKIIPSFMRRVDIEDRGVVWSKYIQVSEEQTVKNAEKYQNIINSVAPNNNLSVTMTDYDSDALNKLVTGCLYESSLISQADLLDDVYKLDDELKINILKDYVKGRSNRRHKPGRGFEEIFYTFDILSDYGSFRDLQRHRMLTVKWQKLTASLGYYLPQEISNNKELYDKYVDLMQRSIIIYDSLCSTFGSELAQYVVPFSFNIRYNFKLNARQAFHLIELRTQKPGHTNYRIICQNIFKLIEEKHPFISELMSYTDLNSYDFGREDAEERIDLKLSSI